MRVHGKFKTTTQLLILTFGEDIGEVWVNMLHNVYAALVAARGFQPQPVQILYLCNLTTRLVSLTESTLDIEIELNFFWQSLLLVTLKFRPILTTRVSLKKQAQQHTHKRFFFKKKREKRLINVFFEKHLRVVLSKLRITLTIALFLLGAKRALLMRDGLFLLPFLCWVIGSWGVRCARATGVKIEPL